MQRFLFSLAVMFFVLLSAQSQDVEYVRSVISKLASPAFHGRGYEFRGDKIAAEYLAIEAEKAGLKPYNSAWFQKYTMSANTHPGKLEVKVDDKILEPGVDYLLNASSPSFKGTYELAWINRKVVEYPEALENMLANDLKDFFIVVDTAGISDQFLKQLIEYIISEKPTKARGIIEITDGNLTYRPSTIKKKFPLLQLKRGTITPDNKTVSLHVKSKFHKKYKTQNVIAYLPGKVDTCIVFSAHYDHLGRMGKETYFPGAHDNASGSAMLLDLARELAKSENYYSYTFMWFSAEEAGILGSKYYNEHPLFPLTKIKYLWNLDLVGSGEDGIKVVNGSVFPETFDRLKALNDENGFLSKVAARGAAANSDHHFFSENGVKAFFIYTMGSYKEYHNIFDRADAVPLSAYNEFYKLLMSFVREVEASKI